MRLEPGVSHDLARERAGRISDLRVALRLSLPAETAAPIRGTATLQFKLVDRDHPLLLDFAPGASGRLEQCRVNDVAIAAAVESEHVVLPPRHLRDGANTVVVEFVAGDAPLNRRQDYLYTIFVPARAREAFPCFDQPDLKARWSLTLELPDDWVAVSNTDALERGAGTGEGRTIVVFLETAPLPTYLFAFAAGRFLEDVAEMDGRELRIYHVETDADAVHANRDAIVRGHAEAVAWLEQYTAIAYPFEKFDIVLLPAFQFGGMEHPGAIFYNSSHLLLTPSAKRQQLLARANVIAHETAHMWFGDLVTMTWFDDVWMKEVFANFMAARIVNPQFPDLDHDLRFLHAHYPAAYDVDRTAGAHPIRQPLGNLNEAGSLYGAIIYLKAPIVMRQLELLLGEDGLRDALRDYLARFAFGNASWPDLLGILAPRHTIDLRAWSHEWIDSAGRPLTRVVPAADRQLTRIELVPEVPSDPISVSAPDGASSRHPQYLQVAVGNAERVTHAAVWCDGRVSVDVRRDGIAAEFVLPNGRGLGYGEFRLDERSRTWLMAHLPDVDDPLTRGSAWLTLWDEMLARHVEPGPLLDLALRSLPRETSELNLQRILVYLERLFWVFSEPHARIEVAARLEAVLRDSLDASEAPTAKAALLATLGALATRPATLQWLTDLWSGDVSVDGLPLQEADHIAIALELAARGDSQSILERQLERTQPGDRRDALAFIAPALSSIASERDRFFDTICDAGNRRREPWVVEGLRWLNHPLRADAAVKYIGPGLDRLLEVRQTGDIFLPKRWLDALLGGHRSAAAALEVTAFLDRIPDGYPDALRRMALASADQLMRAAYPFSSPR